MTTEVSCLLVVLSAVELLNETDQLRTPASIMVLNAIVAP